MRYSISLVVLSYFLLVASTSTKTNSLHSISLKNKSLSGNRRIPFQSKRCRHFLYSDDRNLLKSKLKVFSTDTQLYDKQVDMVFTSVFGFWTLCHDSFENRF
eukprot:315487_1